jgi:hypothetical protein
MVEPVTAFERGIFDGLYRPSWSPPVDDLGLVKVIDRLGQSVVIAVADTAERGFDARPDRDIGEVRDPEHIKARARGTDG